jgi:pyrroloquinoline quinone biosynthesis protein D
MTDLIAPRDVPFLPRGVRLQRDRVRGIRVLQAPERAMQLDQIGEAILTELDGLRSMNDIVNDLAARYNAPADQIAGDVRDFLTGLIERRMVFVKETT